MSTNVEFETWKFEIAEKLRKMIKDWEERIPEEDDDTLYSLALRRALDVVEGREVDLGP